MTVLSRDEETIVALSTATGAGAIALIRLSGINVRSIVSKFSKFNSNTKSINQVKSGTVHFGYIIDQDKNIIDEVLFIVMDGPKTFSGQDTIEISCHNNPVIINNIISLAIKNGAREAHKGEFTKRAFLNGKIDLIQAESINELISANNQLALKQALSQLEGSFSQWINQIEIDLIKTLAWCEASFEFLDEEQEFGKEINIKIANLISQIKIIKKTFDVSQQIKQGIKIAIIGSVNAGKSSLFNSLLNQKRAIVTDIAGTTRDVIEAGITYNSTAYTIIDTAGLRETENIVEQEGIKKSFDEIVKADIVLLVFDGSKNLSSQELNIYQDILNKYKDKIIIIQNKIDLPEVQNNIKADVKVSSLGKLNIDKLEKAIETKALTILNLAKSPFLVNQRQFNLLLSLENKLETIRNMLEGKIAYELLSFEIKEALEYLTELTGKSITEAGLDMVFKEFCVGK